MSIKSFGSQISANRYIFKRMRYIVLASMDPELYSVKLFPQKIHTIVSQWLLIAQKTKSTGLLDVFHKKFHFCVASVVMQSSNDVLLEVRRMITEHHCLSSLILEADCLSFHHMTNK